MPAPAADGLLASLDPEQRAAAELPDGPAQVIAPAGSGKTTTLIARLGVLLDRGAPPDRIGVVTFNRDAAAELGARIASRLAPHVPGAEAIEVRTLHAMARQVLLDAGRPVRLVPDRLPLLRAARRQALAALRVGADGADPPPEPPDAATLNTIVSAWKVEGRPPPPEASAAVEAFAALLGMRGQIDFDDLVVGAVAALEADSQLLSRWQARFSHLCVDEFQDVDAAQLRLVRILAAPEDNLFVVGDDDQTIYAWRLADVRRILSFGVAYPGAVRVQLATNYRCPPVVVRASSRLVAHNRERFAKRIVPAPTRLARAGDLAAWNAGPAGAPEAIVSLARTHVAQGRRLCFLARTRSDLEPIMAALLRAGIPHVTSLLPALLGDATGRLLRELRISAGEALPFHALLAIRARMGWRRGDPSADDLSDDDQEALDAVLGWSTRFDRVGAFIHACDAALARLVDLRRRDAPVELATVHASKGREWQTVVIVGFEDERFPNRRALTDSAEPGRALEEERRLAYVALTRATEQLVLAFDLTRVSRFVAEMGYRVSPRSRTER